MAVMRQLTKKKVRAMKRARVDRVTGTVMKTSVMATMVVAMMASNTKDTASARPHINQLRSSDYDNSKGNEDNEVGKGNGDGGYGEDDGDSDDGKRQQRQCKSTQHNNQPKATREQIDQG
jgi:hypothetical protein